MSFFDEADEPPPTEIRSPSRAPRRRGSRTGGSGSGGSGSGSRGGGGSRGSGSGGSSSRRRRPPGGGPQQSILARRAIAVAGVIIIVVLIAVGVNSCDASARKSALRDYANNVNSIIADSDATSSSLFKALGGGGGSATEISQSISQTESTASGVLHKAQGLSVPGAAKTAQRYLVLALQMRVNGISAIASEIQPALATSVRNQAVNDITAQMAQFYASDVIYKDYAAPAIVSALHGDGIAVGGDDGAPVNDGQFLPDVQWVTQKYVAAQLGVALSGGGAGSSSAKNGSNGLRGSALNSVSVAGSTLTPSGSATIPASPTPSFTLSFTDTGDYDEYDVGCQVKVGTTGDTGTKIVPETFKGKTSTCTVTLPHDPPKGTDTVTATIEKVPGETNLDNNSQTFTITFN